MSTNQPQPTHTTPPPHRISDIAPVFPCWLWFSCDASNSHWWTHYKRPVLLGAAEFYTHWHPDQPEPPTARPEQDSAVAEYARKAVGSQTHLGSPQPAPTAAGTQARITQLMDDARKHPAYAEQGRAMDTATGTPLTDAEVERLYAGKFNMQEIVDQLTVFAGSFETSLAAAQAELVTLRLRFAAFQGGRTVLEQAHAETLAKLEEANRSSEENLRACQNYMEIATHVRAKLTAAEQQVAELTREREAARKDKVTALYLAIGCLDYSGGHRSDDGKLEIYHHGIQTVINVIKAWNEKGFNDTQVAAVRNIGIAAIQPEDGKSTQPN